MKFRVTQHATDNSSVPSTLRALLDLGEPELTRNFSFDYTKGHWTIDGQSFDANRTDARPALGTTEQWVFTNPTGSTHMVHTHDVDQQCVSRNGGPCYPWNTMKETWSLGAGETLAVKMKFTDHLGIYMFHCHILEHEDDGMMTQFEVVAPLAPRRLFRGKPTAAAERLTSIFLSPVRRELSAATAGRRMITKSSPRFPWLSRSVRRWSRTAPAP